MAWEQIFIQLGVIWAEASMDRIKRKKEAEIQVKKIFQYAYDKINQYLEKGAYFDKNERENTIFWDKFKYLKYELIGIFSEQKEESIKQAISDMLKIKEEIFNDADNYYQGPLEELKGVKRIIKPRKKLYILHEIEVFAYKQETRKQELLNQLEKIKASII